jgi:hypothetical protein
MTISKELMFAILEMNMYEQPSDDNLRIGTAMIQSVPLPPNAGQSGTRQPTKFQAEMSKGWRTAQMSLFIKGEEMMPVGFPSSNRFSKAKPARAPLPPFSL